MQSLVSLAMHLSFLRQTISFHLIERESGSKHRDGDDFAAEPIRDAKIAKSCSFRSL